MSIKTQYLDQRFPAGTIIHPKLPFFHSCDAYFLDKILVAGELQTRLCNVYNENLLYLFYGRPAYKSAYLESSGLDSIMPMTFIINNDAITKIKRALPFDSGAFSRYSKYVHSDMNLEDFELTPEKESLNKIVDYFFAGNDPYFNGEAKRDLEYDRIHSTIESYHAILTDKQKTELDDRKSSLEIQLDYNIPVTKENIEAIILPKHIDQSPTVKKWLENAQIPTIPITNYGVPSSNYYVHILEKTKEHLIKNCLLHGN